ncbi:MAG: hypothetical protein ACREIR_06265 [Geminicoccaceae bacterium]
MTTERALTPALALPRRAILRALGSSPVILTMSGTSARAQARRTFGTSICLTQPLISNPDTDSEVRDVLIQLCRLFHGF